jgi:hypothetical protein
MATQTKLHGPLLWMVVAAALICIVALLGILTALGRLREIGVPYMIAVGFITLWAAAFLVMTVLRMPATPQVASMGLVVWLAFRMVVVIATGAITHWPLLIDLLGEAAMAAGFCGYMLFADQPKAYYRGRVA